MDSSGVLWQMALLLAYFRAPASGTFLNLGSGTCQADGERCARVLSRRLYEDMKVL